MNINAVGLLQFDYEDYYGYKCKLSQLSEAVIHPVELDSFGKMTYIITLTATFETVENNNAISQYMVTGSYPNTVLNDVKLNFGETFNEDGLSELEIQRTSSDNRTFTFKITFKNRGDIATPFRLFVNNINNIVALRTNNDNLLTSILFYLSLNTTYTMLYPNNPLAIEFDSSSGAIFSGTRLIEEKTITGQPILLSKISNSNIKVNVGETVLYLIIENTAIENTSTK